MTSPKSVEASVAERILRLQDEWDALAESPSDVELTEKQRAELARRLQAHTDSPDDVVTWEQVKRGLSTDP